MRYHLQQLKSIWEDQLVPAVPILEKNCKMHVEFLKCFPHIGQSLATFEGLFAECVCSIEQSCKMIQNIYKKTH